MCVVLSHLRPEAEVPRCWVYSLSNMSGNDGMIVTPYLQASLTHVGVYAQLPSVVASV